MLRILLDFQSRSVSTFRELRDYLRGAFLKRSDPLCRFVYVRRSLT